MGLKSNLQNKLCGGISLQSWGLAGLQVLRIVCALTQTALSLEYVTLSLCPKGVLFPNPPQGSF